MTRGLKLRDVLFGRVARVLVTAVVICGVTVSLATRAASQPSYTSQLVYFAVDAGSQRCTMVGELFRPGSATAQHPAPAVLTTHGFGGSYQDQTPFAQHLATNGYVVLTFSSLGFGGSSCKITVADPAIDGPAVAQLVSFLGGETGRAFADSRLTTPLPAVDFVVRDSIDHRGNPSVFDPRVGMTGASYGGGIQFAAASVDARIDTLVPLVTWNDLSYSLAPNGASQGTGVSTSTPGAIKSLWSVFFFGYGAVSPGPAGYVRDPARGAGCPNLTALMCTMLMTALPAGQPDAAQVTELRRLSVGSYIDAIRVPVLLIQGEQDTLFDLNEAAATYTALRARGVPARMIWQSWGHSNLFTPAPGEFDRKFPNNTQYITRRIGDWLDHYLRGGAGSPGPEFAYFRDWVAYSGDVEPAYATAGHYPVGAAMRLNLSGDGTLTGAGGAPGARTIVTANTGFPAEISAPNLLPALPIPNVPVLGTRADWTSAPLSEAVDVVGAPKVTLELRAPGETLIFAKIYDIAPDGSQTLIGGATTPVRIANPAGAVDVTLSAIVHRFAPGHSIRLSLSGSDVSYRNSITPLPVTVISGGLSTLVLPRVN